MEKYNITYSVKKKLKAHLYAHQAHLFSDLLVTSGVNISRFQRLTD